MQSCFYAGWVKHRRFTPARHQFRYPIFLAYLDLDELERLPLRRPLWGTERAALASFYRRDHLGDAQLPLAECVRDLVEAHGEERPRGAIRLLTHPRHCGFVMNPVSFYYCFHEDESLAAIVAEVTNTPWGERHCYVLSPRQFGQREGLRPALRKEFHVSPFMPMDVDYRWRASPPGELLRVGIQNYQQGERFFDVQLHLARRELTSGNLARLLARYPLMTARVAAGIYWQALRLWWKGCPYYPHPKKAIQEPLAKGPHD